MVQKRTFAVMQISMKMICDAERICFSISRREDAEVLQIQELSRSFLNDNHNDIQTRGGEEKKESKKRRVEEEAITFNNSYREASRV
jgi:hypothetical protein